MRRPCKKGTQGRLECRWKEEGEIIRSWGTCATPVAAGAGLPSDQKKQRGKGRPYGHLSPSQITAITALLSQPTLRPQPAPGHSLSRTRCGNLPRIPAATGKYAATFLLRQSYDSAQRALRKALSQGPASPQLSGCQELQHALTTRSGWGIMMVTRPSALHRPVIPQGDPLGL